MSVEFDEKNNQDIPRSQTSSNSDSTFSANQRGMIGFLIKKGIVTSESQASLILTIIMLVFFVVAGYLLWTTFGPEQTIQLTPEQLEQVQKMGSQQETNN